MNRERAAELLERHGLAAALACSPENVRYWTGFDCFQHAWNRIPRAALVAPVERPFLVIPMSEAGFAVDQGIDERFEIYVYGAPNLIIGDDVALEPDEARIAAIVRERRFPDPVSATRAALAAHGVRGQVVADTRFAAQLGCESGEDLLRLIRMVKTPAEVERLRAAAALNERGIRAALAQIGRGTGREVARAHWEVVSAGGGYVQHWQGSPGREAGAYRHPSERRAQPGDRWVFDTGITRGGYCSDLGGTVQVGAEPSARERELLDALAAGIDEALAGARPGVLASELYERALAAIRANGHPSYSYSMLGHGIGVEPRDLPMVGPPALLGGEPFDPVLEAGMVLNFETPVIELGVGGFQLELTCVVTPDGGELLSPRRGYEMV